MPALTDGYIVKYQQSSDKFVLAPDGEGIPDVPDNTESVWISNAWVPLSSANEILQIQQDINDI